jgi:hypothetical protein
VGAFLITKEEFQMALKVALSPFFGGEVWQDELTGITFEKSSALGTVTTYDLSRVDPKALTNVRKAIRLNALIVTEGEIEPEELPVEKPTVAAKVAAKVEEKAPEAVESTQEVEEEKKPAKKEKA